MEFRIFFKDIYTFVNGSILKLFIMDNELVYSFQDLKILHLLYLNTHILSRILNVFFVSLEKDSCYLSANT